MFARTTVAAAAFALASLVAPAPRADVTLPFPSQNPPPPAAPAPDEIACHDDEWPAIKKAALAYARDARPWKARVVRHAFRSCGLAPILQHGDGADWSGSFTDTNDRSYLIKFSRHSARWRVLSVEEQCYED